MSSQTFIKSRKMSFTIKQKQFAINKTEQNKTKQNHQQTHYNNQNKQTKNKNPITQRIFKVFFYLETSTNINDQVQRK